MQFTDEVVLYSIEQRYGARMAERMPQVGPMVLDILKSFDGAFRMRHAAEQMRVNGFAAASLAQRRNIALAVVRYINLSDEPLYYQRKHISGTQAWVQLQIPAERKSQLRDLELEYAERSRRVIVYESERSRESDLGQQPIARAPTQAGIPQSHMDSMRTGLQAFMQKIGAPWASIKSADAALRMYDAAVMDGHITESDEMTEHDAERLKAMLRVVFGLGNNS